MGSTAGQTQGVYEHKRPLFAFVLVTVICAIVVGTTMKSQAILGLISPDRRPAAAAPPTAVTPAPVKISIAPAKNFKPKVVSSPVVQAKVAPAPQVTTETREQPRQPSNNGNNPSPNGTTGKAPEGDRHPDNDNDNDDPDSQPAPPDRGEDPTEGFDVIEAITGPTTPVTDPLAPPGPPPLAPAPVEPEVPDAVE